MPRSMSRPSRCLSWCGLLLSLLLLVGCDAPLQHDALIHRLGTGGYASFQVTFYRFSPSQMQQFVAGVGPEQYLFDAIVESGPIERLQFVYTPRSHRVTVMRTGNDVDVSHRLTSQRKSGGRGPVEQVIRVLKAEPVRAGSWFERDLYKAVPASDPDYFLGFDRILHQRLMRQSGTASDWQYVELALTYPLLQAGAPVYTAEAALIPLTSAGSDGPLVSALLSLADREFAALPDPLSERDAVGY